PPPTPTSPLFPYTTLFRSLELVGTQPHAELGEAGVAGLGDRVHQGHLRLGTDRGRGVADRLARGRRGPARPGRDPGLLADAVLQDRKSTRLNSSHLVISYA